MSENKLINDCDGIFNVPITLLEDNSLKISVKLVDPTNEIDLPEYATEGASAMDIKSSVHKLLNAQEIFAVPTNISVEIPRGYEIQVRPRSGLAIKNGITVLNTPGTIDSDYRGEIKVILYNTSKEDYLIVKGERIAQIVLAKVEKISWNQVSEISDTNRGSGGFGHTGK